jgi:succinate-semialdehyde dehydrogenase/glutarate-semialdehyde dehydrogenase
VSGQVCIAPKRFIVPASLKEEIETRVVKKFKAAVMGDPMNEETTFGPLARGDLRENVAKQVDETVAQGAKLLLGGAIEDGPGFYYPATVLTDIPPGSPAYSEEVFGPVAAIIAVADEEEALRVANDTAYGLGAAVFSGDPERAERMARSIDAGACFVNANVRSDARLPFGGVKKSGFGRELGPIGIREFTNAKTVYVA